MLGFVPGIIALVGFGGFTVARGRFAVLGFRLRVIVCLGWKRFCGFAFQDVELLRMVMVVGRVSLAGSYVWALSFKVPGSVWLGLVDWE